MSNFLSIMHASGAHITSSDSPGVSLGPQGVSSASLSTSQSGTPLQYMPLLAQDYPRMILLGQGPDMYMTQLMRIVRPGRRGRVHAGPAVA